MTLPLSGIRVVDLTVAWAGPGATTLLGDLGAEVIRVEGIYRQSREVSAKVTKEAVTGLRYSYNAFTYANADPGDRPYDRSSNFNWHARNKLSVSMCLETPEGKDAFMRLIQKSDVFVENNSKAVLEKLGIDWDTLHAANPRLIVARAPALGLTGQMSHYLGYGPNFNALVGIQAMDGYADCDPTVAGANYHMDEATPGGLAFAVLAALWDRDRSGCGQLIEFAQAENMMVELGEYFLDYQMNGRTPPRLGNGDPYLLQDVFPTVERDVWVTISIRGDHDWNALADAVGSVAWIDKGKTALERKANSSELKHGIAEWTRVRTAAETVSCLQRSHVPAMEVMSEVRLLEDVHLSARGWFQERSHPEVGTFKYIGHPWRADGINLAWGRPVPSFGEDNNYVYKQILEYSDAEIADLTERGLIATEQKV
jgi:crotonobetainyl-CoA:carnitine CoA-transferase CaiB-like acyl-CoA transferase